LFSVVAFVLSGSSSFTMVPKALLNYPLKRRRSPAPFVVIACSCWGKRARKRDDDTGDLCSPRFAHHGVMCTCNPQQDEQIDDPLYDTY